MNADLHMSDVSSSSSDENPENPEVLQPSRPIVVDPESILAELAASESDQHGLLDSQGLIVDNPSPPDPSTTHEEPEVKDQPTAESSTSNLSVPDLSISENSSACSSDPGAEGIPPSPLVSENSSVSDNVSENSSVPDASSAATSVASIHPLAASCAEICDNSAAVHQLPQSVNLRPP